VKLAHAESDIYTSMQFLQFINSVIPKMGLPQTC